MTELRRFFEHFDPGQFPLHEAALSRDETRLKGLISSKYGLDVTLPQGDTALHLSAHSGLPRMMQLLLDGGAEVNSRDQERFTPLHFAVYPRLRDYYEQAERKVESRLECCRLLRAGGAEIDAVGGNGQSPLHLATEQASSLEDDIVIVKYLLEQGADTNKADRKGRCPLHYLWCCEFPEVFQLLIAYGADPLRVDGKGRSIRDLLDCDNNDILTLLAGST